MRKDLTNLDVYKTSGNVFMGLAYYKIPIGKKTFSVVASIDHIAGKDILHVSVSHNAYMPTWYDMCTIKDLFFDDEEEAYQIHPKKSEYVNFHSNCLHLWSDIVK